MAYLFQGDYQQETTGLTEVTTDTATPPTIISSLYQ